MIKEGLEDTLEILQWYNLGATYTINLSNVGKKELEHVRWKKKKEAFHIWSVINLNELYSRRIVSACLSSERLKFLQFRKFFCISVEFC